MPHSLAGGAKGASLLRMTDKKPNGSRFHHAREDARFATQNLATPQTDSPAYRLAFQDTEFLLREDLRPVRFQLELLKPELLLDEAKIASMLVIYGSARIPAPDHADALVAAAKTPEEKRVAERLAAKACYYREAMRLAAIASGVPQDAQGNRQFVVCSGGGPSIMEAANRGAQEAGAESVGLNIVLPHEQAPNPYVTPSLSFQFHYFALRKMHFLLRARAVCVFPGGFGTFDETFELLTLIQTGKMKAMPIVLFGKDFWTRVINFEALADEGVINRRDTNIFRFVETAEEAWAHIVDFWKDDPLGALAAEAPIPA